MTPDDSSAPSDSDHDPDGEEHTDEGVEYVYVDEDGNVINDPTTAEIEAAVLFDEGTGVTIDGAASGVPGTGPAATRARRSDRSGRSSRPSAAERRRMTRGQRTVAFARRHRILTGVAIVLLPFVLYLSATFARAMTKPGQESRDARAVQWARDSGFGFAIDFVEEKYYSQNQPESGGVPQQGIGPGVGGGGPISTPSTEEPEDGEGEPTSTSTTKALRPHTPLPTKMPTPAAEPLPQEGEWFPAGPDLGDGLHSVYTTKVRPNAEKTSLLVFVAWIDPKLSDIRLYPGNELPGGQWSLPSYVTEAECPNLVFAGNGGFRFEIPRTGYWSEGRNSNYPLRNDAASLVIKKDGSVDVVLWGRELGDADLGDIASVRQNLNILVDDGKPNVAIDSLDWGALLPNSYFVWRSAYGVTKDGALVYVGGPGLTPRNLADTLINAGAVRGLQMDINPEWVTGNLYTVNAQGACEGTRGLDATEDKGGMRKPGDRYLSLDTRDFVAVFAKP